MEGRRRSIIALGLLISCVFPIFSATASETVSYGYDALGRLIKVARSRAVNNGVSACYAYDEAANRSNVTAATSSDCNTGASPPSFSVNDGVTTEGSLLVFIVTKAGPAAASFSVNYATSNGTAASGSDYTAVGGTITFAPGQVSKQIAVPTTYASSYEATESLNFTLSSPTDGATISDALGVGTITDNGTPPSFSIGDFAATEGSGVVLTVTKTGTTSVDFSVNYATANGTAVVDSDYTVGSGTLTFTGADTIKTITVATIDDLTIESSETVLVNLSNATGGATVTDAQGAGTIHDNDAPPNPPNTPPVANTDTLSVQVCKIATKNVTANDTDPDGDLPLTLISVSGGTRGFASVYSGTSVQYEASDQPGSDTLTYTIQDARGATSNGTLAVTVTSAVCQ